jgi:hypothetical protein
MSRRNKMLLAVGLLLIIAGAVLKNYSSTWLGDLLSPLGVIIALYSLFTNQQANLLRNQERMTSILEEIRNVLRGKEE